MKNYAKFKLRAGLSVFLLSLISFVLLYLRISYVFESELTIYGSYFFQYLIDTLVPVIIAAAVFAGHGVESHVSRIFSALKLSLTRLVYLIPYYYLYYMSEGYDSLESLGLLLIRSAFMLILFTAEIHLYYFAARFAARRANPNGDFYEKSSLFDFSCSATVGIFAICFAKFIMNIVSEIISIITYLIDYEEFYSADEVYFMIGKFALAFIGIFLSHIIIVFFKAKFAKKHVNTQQSE